MKTRIYSGLLAMALTVLTLFGCGGGGGGGGTPPGGGVRPVASFTVGTISGTVPLTVTFTDTSSNAPTSWSWNFGDGTTSTSQNPTHVYTAVGTYTVTMSATNAAGTSLASATATITVNNQPVDARPVAAFTPSVVSGTAPLTVTFTDNSSNTPTSWSWNFGDGTTSTSQNPTHVYTAAGTYTVTMSATNAVGTSLAPATTTITVSNPPNVTTLAVVTVALQGTLNAGQEIGSVHFDLSIPPGVTARTNPAPAPVGETASSVVVASGVAATGSDTRGNYTPPVGATPGNINVLVSNISGFSTGEFVKITFDYTGTAPVLGDFVLSNLQVSDANSSSAFLTPQLTPSQTLEFQ